MNFSRYQSYLKILTQKYQSCSLINADGTLLYSKDERPDKLTTTRLVSFQIVKKYLNPKVSDIFILNDPENGGYQHSKLIFISCLHRNLFLVWDEDYFPISYKIPPTPLYEQGQKNEFVWQALTSVNKNPEDLESFLEYQKHCFNCVQSSAELLEAVSNLKNQQAWLKASQDVFNIQFSNKALGSHEATYRLNSGASIKLKFTAEERQNVRTVTLDFTNTQICGFTHAASHVIESALVKKIIDFYQINEYFTQSILDKIRILLPPKSVVSKPNSTGASNYELQTICSQMCEYDLQQLNTHSRKSPAPFVLANFLNFEIFNETCHIQSFLSDSNIHLQGFEDIVEKNIVRIDSMKKTDGSSYIAFQINSSSDLNLRLNNHYLHDKTGYALILNKKIVEKGTQILRKNDLIELLWKHN